MRVSLTERGRECVCVCELGQADNRMASEGTADKTVMLLGVTGPC